MKTKYILNGGFTADNKEKDNSEFYVEILKDVPQNSKILLVCFAKEIETVNENTTRVKAEFNQTKTQNQLIFEVANEQNFIEQIQSADVIYFIGDKTLKSRNT